MTPKHTAWMFFLGALLSPSSTFAGGFRVVFEDGFDGTTLDRDKWATRYVYKDGTLATLNDEAEDYDDAKNHVVSGGVLALVARPKPGGNRYQSGMIRSRRTFYFGYFEARVQLPEARGVWPAFWLNSDYDADGRLAWPPEIDAFEYVINGTNEKPDMIHSGVAVGKTGAQGGAFRESTPGFERKWTFFRAKAPLHEGWQTVGLLWKPDCVSVYLNGHKLYTREYKWVYNDGAFAGPAHVLLNLAVGGKWAGLNGVDAGKFPQSLRVDYVRVCQFDPAMATPSRCADSPIAPAPEEGAYATPYDDLPRTRLVSAALSSRAAAAGSAVSVRYTFEAVATPSDHFVRTAIENAKGEELYLQVDPPPVPTSRWHGTQVVEQRISLPRRLSPGRYRVLVSVGSGGHSPPPAERRLSLAAAPSFGVPDGKMRLLVGELMVGRPE